MKQIYPHQAKNRINLIISLAVSVSVITSLMYYYNETKKNERTFKEAQKQSISATQKKK